jgi:pSer/pThr/pTyr-binding forkhead associated (FHA) protein
MIDDLDRHARLEEDDAAVALAEPEVDVEPVLEEFHAAKIVLKRSGVETEHEFPLTSPMVIGRFDPGVGPVDVDLGPLPEGAYVSRKHAKLEETEDGWVLSDLGSSNGTFVLRSDFERVESAPLESGTEFALGNARFVFYLV